LFFYLINFQQTPNKNTLTHSSVSSSDSAWLNVSDEETEEFMFRISCLKLIITHREINIDESVKFSCVEYLLKCYFNAKNSQYDDTEDSLEEKLIEIISVLIKSGNENEEEKEALSDVKAIKILLKINKTMQSLVSHKKIILDESAYKQYQDYYEKFASMHKKINKK